MLKIMDVESSNYIFECHSIKYIYINKNISIYIIYIYISPSKPSSVQLQLWQDDRDLESVKFLQKPCKI